MVMTELYDNEGEKSQHSFAIESLVRDLGLPLDEVHRHYEEALKNLKTGARVRLFLSVLASRRVRETLSEKDIRKTVKRG
jgi:hypothetical protein